MTQQHRHRLLAAALLATLLAAWLAPDRPEDSGTAVAALPPLPDLLDWPQPPEPLAGVTTSEGPDTALATARRPARERASADAAAPATKPPATPPAPPFRMFGHLERNGETVAFVTYAGRTLTVTAGQPLPGNWQVESIGNDGMVLTYLPLGQTASIPFKAPAQ